MNQLYISPLNPNSIREFKAEPKFKVDKNKERLKKMLATKLHVNTLSKGGNSGSAGNLTPNRKTIGPFGASMSGAMVEGNRYDKQKQSP